MAGFQILLRKRCHRLCNLSRGLPKVSGPACNVGNLYSRQQSVLNSSKGEQ